jgi:quinol monooxygenase YgiN
MTDDRLVLIVEFRAAAGRTDDLRTALLALVAPTRAEAGCLQYDLHEDPSDPDVLAFYEIWADGDAHAAHDRTEHVRAISAAIPGLTAEPPRFRRLRRVEPDAL